MRFELLIALAALVAGHAARAQPVDVPPTWGGDLESRPRLTGNWGGLRDELGKKGIVFDVDLLLTPQEVTSGGRSTGGGTWGNVDYTLNIDTQKAGWWPGGFFKLEGDTGFGSNALYDSGAIVPVNTAALLPGINDRTTALTNATFMQFFSETLGVVLGKFNTFDLGETEFYGDCKTQFLNTAFVFPTTLEQTPISAWGGGLIALPTKDLTLSALALNPTGTPTTNPVFGDGVEVLANAQLTVRPWGLFGHQAVGYSWNDKERYSLDQEPGNIARLLLYARFPQLANPGPELIDILERFFPGLLVSPVPPNTKSSSWAFTYTMDQYFWQAANTPNKGLGVFFSFGASDGNPNPIKHSYLAGLGGKDVVPGRANDNFGLGFAYTQFSNDFLPFLRERLNLGLDNEKAFEMYYNAALTAWLDLSGDLQIVYPGFAKTLTGLQLTDVNTAVVAGLRIRARF